MNNKKRTIRSLILGIGVPVLIILIFFLISSNTSTDTVKTYSEALTYFDVDEENSEKVKSYDLSFDSSVLKITLLEEYADPKKPVVYTVPSVNLFVDEVRQLRDKFFERKDAAIALAASTGNVSATDVYGMTAADYEKHPLNNISWNYEPMHEASWLESMIPTLLMLGFMVVIWVLLMRRINASMGDGGKQMSFGKAKIKNVSDEKRKTTFDDVAGADEEKEELEEIVEFLKSPKKFNDLGAHIPKGVLLVGPPGTGKTLLARAVAGEAGVPFFSISGSDFVEMFVGVGASRVRDLFDQAKKNSPCIVFIDEIDAVGRHRGAGLGGGHDEREQTLNQLLVEMDGFGANEGVIIIAATNRPDILDPALTRPGRFDRQVMVGYPDIKGREEILKVHSRKKPLGPDIDLGTIAKSTAGFTGADLENLLNESALLAARRDQKAITMREIEEATIKVIAGTEKKSKVISEKEKRITAVHEAGHAVVTYFCETQDPVHQISIIPRGMAGGYTMSLPQEDKSYRIKGEMIEDIIVLLGGRVAESIALGDISTGASNDIERATKMAREMVMKYGMSEKLGPISFGSSEGSEIFLGRDMGHVKDFSDEVAHQIDIEVKDIITSCFDKAKSILTEHRNKLDEVSDYLMKNEKMDGSEFKKLMSKTALDF